MFKVCDLKEISWKDECLWKLGGDNAKILSSCHSCVALCFRYQGDQPAVIANDKNAPRVRNGTESSGKSRCIISVRLRQSPHFFFLFGEGPSAQ